MTSLKSDENELASDSTRSASTCPNPPDALLFVVVDRASLALVP
jgi:hypothetical protein